jgi:membrane complex biogenesis BtpA family protein
MKLPRLIGVIHLSALAGSPGAYGKHPAEVLQIAGMRAVKEAQIFAKAGYDALILENFGDSPFYKTEVPPETIASLAIIAAAVRDVVNIQIGINVLRNDARSALAIAAVTGCDFIRVNVLSGVAATDQGWVEGDAAFLLRERDRLQSSVAIFADVHVKHAVTFSNLDLALALEEVGARAAADAVIISGRTTGRAVDRQSLEIASHTARKHKIPLYIGSGATRENLKDLKPWVDGVIVGSDLRRGGRAGAELDLKRSREFSRTYRLVSKSKKRA